MDIKVQNKINSIIAEINAIASELEDVSHDLVHEFKGIGATNSASSLQQAANQYRNVTHELRKI